jgi:putative ATP-binding cassette transporter
MIKEKSWRYYIAIVFLLSSIFNLLVYGEGPPITIAEIEEKVQTLMKKGNIPGLCLVIIQGEEIPYVKGFGYASLEDKVPVNAETLFELASCSKAFTGLAVLRLEEEGSIHLDDPVSKYLPGFFTEFAGKRPGITLRQLLHHTSGIPMNSIARIPQSSSSDALEQTVKTITGIKLNRLPGKQYEYATINYDILGLIIQEVSGRSFEEYMKDYIFTPLGLSRNTRVGVTEDNPSMATGYKIGFFKPRKYTAPVFRGNNPAGYIVSNGNDIARWLRIQLGSVKTDLSTLIPKSHNPDLSVNPDQTEFSSYGAGWIVYQFKDKVMYHNGLNPNFTSFISVDPGKQLGVAVLANSNSSFTDHIGKDVMNLLSGRHENPNLPSQSKVDLVGSILSLVVGFYVACVLVFIILRLIGIIRGKNKLEPFTGKKILRIIGAVLLGIPYLIGIYLLPDAIGGFNWETVIVWSPVSLFLAAVLVAIAFFVSYILYILSLLFPSSNKYLGALPLIAALGMLSGIANTGVLFIITTAFFSPVSLGYLLFYFLMIYSIFLLGTKIVSTKMIRLTNNITLDLRVRLVETLIASRYQQFEQLQDGRIFTTLNADTAVLAGSAGMVIGLITSTITAVSAFAYLATISFIATLVVLGVVFILAGYYYFVSKAARVFMEEARDTQNVYMSLINGLIRGFKQLAIHRNKRIEYKDDLIGSCRRFRDKSITARIKFLNSGLIGNSFIMIILGMLSIVVPRAITSVKTITLISFVMVLLYLIGPVNAILGAIPGVTTIRVSWDRIKEFIKDLEIQKRKQTFKGLVRMLDRPVREEIKTLVRLFHPGKQTVESLKIDNITFEYDAPEESERFRIGPIDFELKKGDVLFLVGGNGCGKTTLAHVLTGLYKAKSGTIKIDNAEIDSDHLGEYFSTIYSNFHLFEKLYATDVSEKEEEVEEYLEMLKLEEKVQLDIDENAFTTLNLSGGQRKRLALLQCYLEDRPIYLFDEMAADQDPEFKRFFYKDLLVRMKEQGKIVIAITHDDHYFDTADFIVKMEDGKVEYKGSGQSLEVKQFLWGPKAQEEQKV